MEEVSFMFPELLWVEAQIQADEVILDSEAVGFDRVSGKILPFQQIITRKRKHEIAKAAKDVPLIFFVFDILYLNGESLLRRPLSDRILALGQSLKGDGVLVRTQGILTREAKEIIKYHQSQLKQGLEGVVVKKRESEYVPGRRGWNWVKFKEAEEQEAKLADTMDCVVMGYYKGRGKRASFGVGGFLVGIRQKEEFVTISKIGTGLSDEQWKELKTRADAVSVKQKPKQYCEVDKTLLPDVWTEPSLVVEIAADNITKSPVHGARYALRFPRLVRFRDDKGPYQVTTLSEIKHFYRLQ